MTHFTKTDIKKKDIQGFYKLDKWITEKFESMSARIDNHA